MAASVKATDVESFASCVVVLIAKTFKGRGSPTGGIVYLVWARGLL
jgi:hypothetical protein